MVAKSETSATLCPDMVFAILVVDVYIADVEVEHKWDLSVVLMSAGAVVCYSLQVALALIHNKCRKYWMGTPSTVADAFRLALHGLQSQCKAL